jgi:hypothetical protein
MAEAAYDGSASTGRRVIAIYGKSAVNEFRRAAEDKDLEAMRATLREDVVLHSPVLFRPFEGRELVLAVLAHVAAVLEELRYVSELSDGREVALRFTARVDDMELEGIDFLELDEDGRVAELTVFMRPMSALTRFNERMAERLGVEAGSAGGAPY